MQTKNNMDSSARFRCVTLVSSHKVSGRCVGQSEEERCAFRQIMEQTLPETGLVKREGNMSYCGEPGCDHKRGYQYSSVLSLKHTQPVHKKRVPKMAGNSRKDPVSRKTNHFPETGLYRRKAAGQFLCGEEGCDHTKIYTSLSELSSKHSRHVHKKKVISKNQVPLENGDKNDGLGGVLSTRMEGLVDLETLDYNFEEGIRFTTDGYQLN